jgi:LSD1 subclass zinc finger protein
MSEAASPNRTIYCGFCSAQLSYPVGSWVIQCPKCNGQQDPSAQQQTRCSNQACNAMLSHPPDSLYIQCPKCENTMNAREEPRLGFVGGSLQASQSKTSLPKKRKDPAAPRAAMNAYMIFCKERRPALSEQYPELGFGQVGSKLGEVWRNMSVTEKKVHLYWLITSMFSMVVWALIHCHRFPSRTKIALSPTVSATRKNFHSSTRLPAPTLRCEVFENFSSSGAFLSISFLFVQKKIKDEAPTAPAPVRKSMHYSIDLDLF